MTDKYGVGQDPYCYPGTGILKNLLGINDEMQLRRAEMELTNSALQRVKFKLPPYDFHYLQSIHHALFPRRKIHDSAHAQGFRLKPQKYFMPRCEGQVSWLCRSWTALTLKARLAPDRGLDNDSVHGACDNGLKVG